MDRYKLVGVVFPPLCDAGVPHQPLLPLSDGTKGDFGGCAGILALLWNGGLWMCFDIGQNILQASLIHLQLVPDVFEWNQCLPQFNCCPLVPHVKPFSEVDIGFTPGGMLLADRLLCDMDASIYVYMCQMKSFSQKMLIFRPI
jgi:hypothetical protein